MHLSHTRRRLLAAGLTWPIATALTACGGGDEAPAASPPPPAPPPEARFTPDGLFGLVVRRLRPGAAGLLAATNVGLWRRTAQGWVHASPLQWAVLDVAAISPTRWVASVHDPVQPTSSARLVHTDDAGAHWQPLANDFGGPDGPEAVQALQWDAAAQRLLASGADVLAVSTAEGGHWQLLAGQWQAFAGGKEALAFDPVSGDVWYGGQDAIEGFALFRRRAAGGGLDSHARLMPSPSTAKGIRFAMGEPGRVLVAGEGGIVHTRSGGASWQPLLQAADHRFYFDVLQDVQRPGRWLTAGWDKNFSEPQPLIVELSDDDGASWQRLPVPPAVHHGGVWSMAAAIEEGRSVVYLGLFIGGVVRLELA